MNASLVYDGGDVIIRIPESMLENGPPFDNQMCGTALEQLGECASRICYDSFGVDSTGKRKGRSSASLHSHILEVNNLSVYEHCNFTVELDTNNILPLINRKGIWIGSDSVTTNLRAILDWDKWTRSVNLTESNTIREILEYWGNQLAPQIIHKTGRRHDSVLKNDLTEDQAWITMYLYGSRGFSMEQVRHRFAISQRSTRYVDESMSPYIMHPLIEKYLNDKKVSTGDRGLVRLMIDGAINSDRKAYRHLVSELELYCTLHGMDRMSAKKQARGAARGNLGNALATEMLFSAPITGWKWILSQRLSKFADAEIRNIYVKVLEELKLSAYGKCFQEYRLIDSPDGIGSVLE